MRSFRAVGCVALLSLPLGLSAANRVGDADNNHIQDMADAALVQSRLYGAVPASAVSPLALADGDATLDLGDLLYVAQIATGARTGVAPQFTLLTITPPAPASFVSGVAPNPVLGFSVVSNYPAATLVDGLDALGWSISSALSTLTNSDMSVAGSIANTELVANNPGPGNDVFDVGLVIDVADSDGVLDHQPNASQTVTVQEATFCSGKPAGTVCSAATDYCDLDDTCDGSAVCVDNGFASVGTLCRADTDGLPPNGGCDAAETCTGSGPACPADGFEPDWTACDDGFFEPDFDSCFAGVCQSSGIDCANGAVGPGEQCDDGNVANGDCCNSVCQYESAGSACGSGSDTACDNPDTCNGTGTCLVNNEMAGTVCLAGTHPICDPDDVCDGLGNCAVLVTPDGTVCGAAAGACDLDDTCFNGACLDNGFAPVGTVCLLAGGGFCDADDTCDGVGNCNVVVAPAGTVCRPDWDGPGCDAQEVCDGVSSNCPTDVCELTGSPCFDVFPSTCDPSCFCGFSDPVCGSISFNGWTTPSGMPVDPSNLGFGDQLCASFSGGFPSAASSFCTVNGTSTSCIDGSYGKVCVPSPALANDLFNPTLANCSFLSSASARYRTVSIQCGIDNLPVSTNLAAYAMPVTDGTIGGPGNGFADGSIQVCAIDRWTGGNIGQAIGIQVEDDSTPPVILHRATIAAGNTCTTITGGSLTGALTVTAASEGYQTFTITKADAREFELPMSKRLSRERAETPLSQTWWLEGDFLLSSFNSIYTATNRHGGCNLQLAPSPIRAGMAFASPYRVPLHNLSLDLLMATEVPKGLMACSGAVVTMDFPGNIASPDMMSSGTGTRANTFFEGIRVTRPTGVLVQSLGIAASAEGLRLENVERYFGYNAGTGSGYAKSATPLLYYFDLVVAGQEMAVVNPGTLCPSGGRCNINSRSATGVSFNIGHMPGYTHNFGTNRWQFWSWDWNSGLGSEVNIMSQFDQSTMGWFGHDPDQWLASNPANVTAAGPQDSDPVRYGADPYFDCAGDANCHSRKQGRRAWRGFIGRDVDSVGVRLRAEQFHFYGLQVDTGLLADTFIPLNFYNGARVEGPNTNGGSATSFAPMGGPLDSTVTGYFNGLLPGAIASGRMLGLGMWFKNGERRVGHLTPLPSSASGTAGCTTMIGPRAGNCVVSGWDDDNTIGLPVPVQDGLGNSPYDMGDAADVTQCVASVAPGEACLAMSGGDVRTLGLGSRTFVFDNNSSALAAPWGDPDIVAHALAVNGGQAFYAGVPAATPANLCVGGDRAGLPCTDLYDCQSGTCTATLQNVSSNDDAWMIVGQGPGMAGGAAQSFVLPDLAAACPSCTPSTALTVKDWRHLNNGATPGGYTDQGPGFHALDLDNCTAPGCKTAARGQCIGGTNPGTACNTDDTACTGGGVCGQTFSGLNWNMFGYGSATMNSCQTANAWHYREVNAGGLGGIEEARNFSVNSTDSIFNE